MYTPKSYCLFNAVILAFFVLLSAYNKTETIETSSTVQELSPHLRSLHHLITFDDNMHVPTELHELNNNIDRLLFMSDHVFIGKVTAEILFNEARDYHSYTVEVIDQWKGKIREKRIDFFPISPLALNQTYLFFSEALDDPVYPRTEYRKLHHEGNFYVYDQLISHIYYEPDQQSEIHSGINIDEIKRYVQDSPYRQLTLEPRFEKPYAIDRLSNRLLIDFADAILYMRVEEVEPINLYASWVRGTIIQHYKDEAYDDRQSIRLHLPPHLVVGEEYLIFIKRYRNYGTTLATRQGSIISKTDDPRQWRRFMQLLDTLSR